MLTDAAVLSIFFLQTTNDWWYIWGYSFYPLNLPIYSPSEHVIFHLLEP